MKKRGNMKIKNFEAFAKRVAQKLDTTIIRVSSDAIWFANYYYINFDGEFIYIADYSKDTPRKVMCAFIYDYNTQKDFFHDLDMIAIKEATEPEEPEENEETEKHYYDYTSEDCIENAECARGNDVFDGCKTVKDVMEVKQELNARFGKEQYFDTDSLQPNKTIIEKIENINHCPNQNTCCIVSPFVHCNYNYKSDSCIKAHKNFIHGCEQVHKQMKAISNPEWHHVSLTTLANIDIDMLDEKRQRYVKLYKELIKTLNDLHKCKTAATYENRWLRFKQAIADDINYRGTTLYMTRFLDLKISMCNVECGLWSSADEKATSFIKSRRYRCTTLK